jgi:23S rRNA pseudouridine2605 synthase
MSAKLSSGEFKMSEEQKKPFRPKREAGNRNERSESPRPAWETRVQMPVNPNKAKSPVIPPEIQAEELPLAIRVQLKTLTEENAERVSRHLAMVGLLIDDDPELAHSHAMAAVARAGRIGLVHEFAGVTAYNIGEFSLALRELLTHRRISGSNDQIALIADSERGMGRPEKALELGRSIDRSKLQPQQRVDLAIAMSGARLDMGQSDLALAELEIPELNPSKVFEYTVPLFRAYAECLRELKREADSLKWDDLAERAEEQFDEKKKPDTEFFDVIEEIEIPKLSDRPKYDGPQDSKDEGNGEKKRPSLEEIRKNRNTYGGDGAQGGSRVGRGSTQSGQNKGGGRGKFGGNRGR